MKYIKAYEKFESESLKDKLQKDLIKSINKDNIKTFRDLIENKFFDINYKFESARFYGEEPIIFHVCAGKAPKILNYLIDSGVDINQKDRWNKTPLSVAAYNSNHDVFKTLIENGADISVLEKKQHDYVASKRTKKYLNSFEFQKWFLDKYPGKLNKLEKITDYIHKDTKEAFPSLFTSHQLGIL